jgi:hypothetical protein
MSGRQQPVLGASHQYQKLFTGTQVRKKKKKKKKKKKPHRIKGPNRALLSLSHQEARKGTEEKKEVVRL